MMEMDEEHPQKSQFRIPCRLLLLRLAPVRGVHRLQRLAPVRGVHQGRRLDRRLQSHLRVQLRLHRGRPLDKQSGHLLAAGLS